jgi:hypothetical protein
MPYVNNHGVRIHYEVEGSGAPLVPTTAFWGVARFGRMSAIRVS